jgi:hypothetical protein
MASRCHQQARKDFQTRLARRELQHRLGHGVRMGFPRGSQAAVRMDCRLSTAFWARMGFAVRKDSLPEQSAP